MILVLTEVGSDREKEQNLPQVTLALAELGFEPKAAQLQQRQDLTASNVLASGLCHNRPRRNQRV